MLTLPLAYGSALKRSLLILSCLIAWITNTTAEIPVASVQRDQPVMFEKDILPIMQKNCLACHSLTEKQGDLVLESAAGILKGGDSGPAAIAGKGSESLLLKVCSHQSDPIMPPEDNDVAASNLTSQELGLLKLWIDQGARGSGGIASLSPKQWRPLAKSIGPVNAVTLSPDGQYVICGRANQLYLYHVPTGQLVTQLSDPALSSDTMGNVAHRDLVQSLAISSAGDLLASGSFREVKLWRRPRDVVRQQINTAADVQAMTVDQTNHRIATSGKDHTIVVWDSQTGQPLQTLSGHTAPVSSLRFSAGGKQLISGSLDQTIRIWNPDDGSLSGLIETPAAVNAVDWVNANNDPNRDERLLVSGGSDKLIRTWQFPAFAPEIHPLVSPALQQAIFRANGQLIVLLGENQKATTISVDPKGVVKQWSPDQASITAIAAAGATTLATASSDHFLTLWSVGEQKQIDQWLIQADESELPAITRLAITADGKRLASGHSDGQLIFWNLQSDPQPTQEGDPKPKHFQQSVAGNKQAVTSLRFSPDGTTLLAGYADGVFRGFNPDNAQQRFATSHGATINDIAISNDGKVIATAGQNNSVRLWQSNGSGFGVSQVNQLPGPATSVTLSPDGSQVIVAVQAESPICLIHETAQGKLLQQYTQHKNSIAALMTDQQGRIGSLDATSIQRWSNNGLKVIAGHNDQITSLAAIPNAPLQVISGSRDSTAKRWDLNSARQVTQFSHGGPVTAVAASPDGSRVATAGENNLARLWNINGQRIADLKGDLRLQLSASRAVQQEKTAQARVTSAKKQLEDAEKQLPTRVEAAKKADEELATADKDLQEKTAALDKATTEKVAAEKLAIEASKQARAALLEKLRAEADAQSAADALKTAQARSTQLVAAANATPGNDALKQASQNSLAAVKTAQAESSRLQQEMKAPIQMAQAAIQKANEMTQKVSVTQKPYTDALTAKQSAETARNLAAQKQAIAARDKREAEAKVPVAKTAVQEMETALVAAKEQVTQANQAAKDSEQPLNAVAFSDDGSLLATGGQFSNVHIWDGTTGTAVAAFAGHQGPTRCVTFLDANTLASTGADQSLRLWDLNPGWKLQQTIGAADQPELISHRVTSLDFDATAQHLLVAGGTPSRSGELLVFHLDDGQRTLFLPQAHDDVIYAAKFSPDGKRIASASADKYIRTFDVISSQPLRRLEGHTNYVLDLAWKNDGSLLASASADNTIKVWNPDTGDQSRTIQNFEKQVTAIRFVGEGSDVVSSCGDRRVRMQRTSNGGNIRNFSGTTAWQHCVDITPDGKTIAAGTADGKVYLWNSTNGQLLKTLEVGQ